MEIKCPICPISIEVSNEHIGSKGRCPNCESKFIIPEDPDDEIEILHRGEIPDKTPDRKVAMVMTGGSRAPQRKTAARVRVQKSVPPVGTIAFGVACTVAAIASAVHLAGDDDSSQNSRDTITSILDDHPEGARQFQLDPIGPAAAEPTDAELAQEDAMARAPGAIENAPQPEPVAEENLPPALTEEQKASALTFIQSHEARKRQAAYAGFRKRGEHDKPVYLEVLSKAGEFHSKALAERADQLANDDNALSKVREDFDAWVIARDAAKKLVQTNWKDRDPNGYKKSHGEMDKAVEKAAKLYKDAMRGADRLGKFNPTGLDAPAEALAEIRVEIAWCEDREPDDPLSLIEAIAEAGGSAYVEALEKAEQATRFATELSEAESHNAGSRWAPGTYQTFATVLNERRITLGLTPLRLEGMLSKACEAHSADMAANGYFSHTGLTPETKTFGDRARRAGFSGFATGECIFMGNPSPLAAHEAWWYSDGHRLIMYADNPNTLGLGVSGSHWTLNTAKL